MGIDVEEFEKKPSVSEELQILFVGRIARVRQIELLLKACLLYTSPSPRDA